MYRTREYRRFQRRRAIHHKQMILRDYWKLHGESFWTPVRIGMLAKGKVHCSCWMCRSKSYDDPGISDKRKAVSADQEMEALAEEDNA